jgi:hypothetical protein
MFAKLIFAAIIVMFQFAPSNGQVVHGGHELNHLEKFWTSTMIVILERDDKTYNEVIQKIIKEHWTLTKFEFIYRDEILPEHNTIEYSFLKRFYEHMYDRAIYTDRHYLAIFPGTYPLSRSISVTISIAHVKKDIFNVPGDDASRYDLIELLIKSLQHTLVLTKENNIKPKQFSGVTTISRNQVFPLVNQNTIKKQGKTLLISDLYLIPNKSLLPRVTERLLAKSGINYRCIAPSEILALIDQNPELYYCFGFSAGLFSELHIYDVESGTNVYSHLFKSRTPRITASILKLIRRELE